MAQRPRPRGERTAQNRGVEWMHGRDLPPFKQALVRTAARLSVHLDNCSNLAYFLTEVRQDDEPRQLIAKMLDLSREMRELLIRAFPEEPRPADPVYLLKIEGYPERRLAQIGDLTELADAEVEALARAELTVEHLNGNRTPD